MEIYTLTLNPAYDVHAYTEKFIPFHENLAKILSREAGGKGVNISRALLANGVANTAVVVLGKDNAGDFVRELNEAGVRGVFLERKGRIRENLTIHTDDGVETRISFTGFSVTEEVLTEIQEKIPVKAGDTVTFTGRVPDGIGMESVKAFLISLRERGVKIVLDSKSFSAQDIMEVRPWLMKPNQEEISEYFSCAIENFEQAADKASAFSEQGIENVMISLGSQGAALLNGGNLYIATPPCVHAISTIGAGDSTIAGFLAAAQNGLDVPACLENAVACGTAACLTSGSQPPRQEDIRAIKKQVTAQVRRFRK